MPRMEYFLCDYHSGFRSRVLLSDLIDVEHIRECFSRSKEHEEHKRKPVNSNCLGTMNGVDDDHEELNLDGQCPRIISSPLL